MNNTLLLIVVIGNLLSFGIAYVSATGNLKEDGSNWLLKHTNKGLVFIFMLLLYSLMSFFQYYFIDQQTQEDKIILKRDGDKRDSINNSIHQKSVDSLKLQYETKTNSIIIELAKYHIYYSNEQNKILTTVRDSLKTIVVQEETPILIPIGKDNTGGISFDSINNTYMISIGSKNATSRNINLKSSVVLSKETKYLYGGERNLFINKTIPSDRCITKYIPINELPKIDYTYLIIWHRGTYYNNELTKKFNFDEMLLYNNITKELFIISESDLRKEIITLINQNEIK